jgi:hypothetical protein
MLQKKKDLQFSLVPSVPLKKIRQQLGISEVSLKRILALAIAYLLFR